MSIPNRWHISLWAYLWTDRATTPSSRLPSRLIPAFCHFGLQLRSAAANFNKFLVTLALGIGANTAIFEILNAVRLRTLPIARPGELVQIRIANGAAIQQTAIGIVGNAFTDFTVPMWREIKEHHDPLSGIFAWGAGLALLGPTGQSCQANALEVSGEFFNVLGVTPVQGRLIEPQDEAACQQSGVVVSYPSWKSHRGGEPMKYP